MASLNLCQFMGNLGKDPESRHMPDGTAVATFSIGCNWKGKNSEGVEWVRCSAFGKTAEVLLEYARKGTSIYVSGRMRTRKYEKDGADHYATEIVVDRFQFLGSKRDDDKQPEKAPSKQQGGIDDLDDDIPF